MSEQRRDDLLMAVALTEFSVHYELANPELSERAWELAADRFVDYSIDPKDVPSELERRLDRIDGGEIYPKVTLCELLSADEIETVDQERELYRIDGTVYNGAGLKDALEDL